MQTTRLLRFVPISALPVLALLTLYAQDQPDSRVWGPVIGFVHDGATGIRPILGVPGAATLGPSILARAAFGSVKVAPEHDYAVALLSRGRQVAVVRNLSTTPSAALLDVPDGPERIVFSPSGDAAALFYSGRARVEVLTGLPDSPSMAWSIDLADAQSGLAALAVSDGGSAILAASAGEPAPIWLAAPEQGRRTLYTVSAAPSLAFLLGSEDAAIVDGLTGEVLLVRDPKGEALVTRISGPAEGISEPLAIAAASDNRRLFVVTAQPAGVVSLGLGGGEPYRLSCACQPTTLERLGGGGVFRLNEPGDGPVWLLNTAAAKPRIVFVPDRGEFWKPKRLAVPRPIGGGR